MVKDGEKPNTTRIYDEQGYRRRAACICVKNEKEDEVLLVTSSRSHERWIVPGGGLEPDEDSREAAVREVIEEAGVTGQITRCLGTFENAERKHRTDVYILIVTKELQEWQDSTSRKRNWFNLEEAVKILSLHKPVQSSYVKLLIKKDKVP